MRPDQEQPDGGPLSITPSMFLEVAAAKISRLNEAESLPVLLRGIPTKSPRPSQVFGGFIYAGIKDPHTRDTIDARLPESMAEQIEWGREAVLTGLIRYKASQGLIRPEFRIDGVYLLGEVRLPSKGDLLARWGQAITRPKRDVEAALQLPRPGITLVTGAASVAFEDICSQLPGVKDDLDLMVKAVSIVRPRDVARAIRDSTEADLVVITRGGGAEVHELDDDELIGTVAASPVPVVTALGHATDRLVLEQVADACFPTPTAFGAWLRRVVEQKNSLARQVVAAKELGQTKDLLSAASDLQAENKLLKGEIETLQDLSHYSRRVIAWWQKASLVLGGLLVVAVAFLAGLLVWVATKR